MDSFGEVPLFLGVHPGAAPGFGEQRGWAGEELFGGGQALASHINYL